MPWLRDRVGGIDRNVTQRKQSEEELRRLNRALQVLSDCNQALVRAEQEQELLAEICRIIVEVGGYRFACAGSAEGEADGTVRCLATAGKDVSEVDALDVCWTDDEWGRDLKQTALRTGQPLIRGNLAAEPGDELWRVEAVKRGYQSLIAVPLIDEGKAFGLLSIFSDNPDAFDEAEVHLLEELAADVAYGIVSIRARVERRRAEEALRASEERLKLAFQAANEGLWDWTVATGEAYFSPRFYTMLGYDPDEFPASYDAWKRLLHPDDVEAAEQKLDEHVNRLKTGFAIEFRMRTKSGNWKWILCRGDVVERDAEGKPVRMIGTNADMTKRKQAEQALRESEEKYRDLIETTGTGYAIVDMQGHIVEANAEFVRLTGRNSLDEVKGRNVVEWTAPHDYERNAEAVKKCAETGFVRGLEIDYVSKDGKITPIEINATVVESAEGPVMLSLCTDISDRRRAEEALRESEKKYRDLIETTATGYNVLDAQGRIIEANAEYVRLTGHNSLDEIKGRNVVEWTAPYDHERNAEAVKKCAETGFVRGLEIDYVSKDGRITPIEINATVVQSADGPVILALCRDISDRRRAEVALRDSEGKYRSLIDDVMDSSPVGIFMLDAQFKVVWINNALERYFGLRREDVIAKDKRALIGERIKGIFEDPTTFADTVLATYDDNTYVESFECHVLPGDGRGDRWLQHSSQPIVSGFYAGGRIENYTDITERKRAEEERRALRRNLEAQKRQFYRETILSVTDGKLDVCELCDVRPFLSKAEKTIDVRLPLEVSPARGEIEAYCRDHGLEGERLGSFIVGVGEAITNAIKHGERGRVYAGTSNGSVWVGVSDKGKGMESLILPRVTLQRGFSTKPSLGLGYSIILEVADHILLRTGPKGTTVILIKDLEEPALTISADELPDTWENIPD